MFDGYKARKRVLELEEDLRKLRARIEDLELQWSDTLSRIKRIMGRIAKSSALDGPANSAPVSESAATNAGGASIGVGDLSHLDPISRKIIERRMRLGRTVTPTEEGR